MTRSQQRHMNAYNIRECFVAITPSFGAIALRWLQEHQPAGSVPPASVSNNANVAVTRAAPAAPVAPIESVGRPIQMLPARRASVSACRNMFDVNGVIVEVGFDRLSRVQRVEPSPICKPQPSSSCEPQPPQPSRPITSSLSDSDDDEDDAGLYAGFGTAGGTNDVNVTGSGNVGNAGCVTDATDEPKSNENDEQNSDTEKSDDWNADYFLCSGGELSDDDEIGNYLMKS